jgi:DNA-binding CsgD family transcriptional regulator
MSIQPLFGRDRELGVLDHMLSRVNERGVVLVMRGEAGIGKTALMATARTHAADRGMRVLIVTGVQAEATLPFAGLHQLLRPILGHASELPPRQRDALLAAFGMTDTLAPDLFLIALAALELLASAATLRPLLLIAEDAQWLDRSTADVLAFVARRLEAEPIALLVAVRDLPDSPLLNAGLSELRLEPLDDTSSRALLDAQAPGLTPTARDRLLHNAEGNPLAIIELPKALRSAHRSGDSALSSSLPLTARLEQAFTARTAELPDATRTLLLVAAADGASDLSEVLVVAAAIRGGALDANDLEPAISRGLIAIEGSTILFRHPLIRSAVYGSAGLSERQAVHAAFGTVLASQPDRSAWHRAAATLQADENVASALEETAMRARQRGATVSAVTALGRAAELSEHPSDRGRRVLRGADLAFQLGRPDLAVPLLTTAESLELGRLEWARVTFIRELVDPRRAEEPAKSHSLIAAAALAEGEGDVDLARDVLCLAATRCWWRDPGILARRDIVAALERLDSADGDLRVTSGLGYAAPFDRGHLVLERLSRFYADDELSTEQARIAGATAVVTGAWDIAPALLDRAIAGLRAHGRLGQLPRILVMQVMVAARQADWSVALPAAEEARALANETAQPIWAGSADAAAALAAAMRGEEERTERLAGDAARVASRFSASHILALAQMARGVAALGAGRPLDAFEELQRLFTDGDPAHHWTMKWWGLADFVEAAVHSHRREACAPLVAELTALVEQTPAFWLHVVLRHARALLADDEIAESHFQEALSADLSHWPFQRAQLLLAYGEWLRRQRRIAESRQPLRAALQTFDAVGAVPWGERARLELRASGEASRERTPEAWDQLSPQELQIAQMAAQGLSNRDIGQRLFLSHRTVGSHLYRIFPKLGITSRSELRSTPGSGLSTHS